MLKQDGRFNELANKLKEDVLVMLKNVVKPLDQLELINHLQRLGVAHLFEEDIDSNLQKIYNHHSRSQWELIKEYDLHSTALEFRLLRRNKYFIPEGKSFSFSFHWFGVKVFLLLSCFSIRCPCMNYI